METSVTNYKNPSFDSLRSGSQINGIQMKDVQGLLGPSGQINIHVLMSVQWVDAIPLFYKMKLSVGIPYPAEVFLPK